MIPPSRNELLVYLADLVEELERYAVTVLPPDDRAEITLGRERDGGLIIDLSGHLPTSPRSRIAELELFERWRLIGPDQWACFEYTYELRHHAIGYRRAFHRHDEDHFVRRYGVATHEHCEATLGIEVCGHYHGRPVVDAFDGFRRLYDTWLSDQGPDCSALVCIG